MVREPSRTPTEKHNKSSQLKIRIHVLKFEMSMNLTDWIFCVESIKDSIVDKLQVSTRPDYRPMGQSVTV